MQTTATLSLQPYLQSRWSFLHTVTWVPGRHQWRCFATACVTDTQHLVVPNASMMYYHTEWYHHISTLNQLDRHGVYRWFCCEKDQIGRALLTASAPRPSLPSVPMPPIRSWSKECRKKVQVKSNFRTMAEWLAYGSGGSWVPRSNPSGGAIFRLSSNGANSQISPSYPSFSDFSQVEHRKPAWAFKRHIYHNKKSKNARATWAGVDHQRLAKIAEKCTWDMNLNNKIRLNK